MTKRLILFLSIFLWILPPLAMAIPANPVDPASPPVPVRMKQAFYLKVPAPGSCTAALQSNKTHLLINGLETGLSPLGCEPAAEGVLLGFYLQRDPGVKNMASEALWQSMLGSPWQSVHNGNMRRIRYAVESAEAEGGVLADGKMDLVVFDPPLAFLGLALIGSMWAGLIWLGHSSGMLRDMGGPNASHADRPYSLARVQMAWWFAIIIGTYVFLWVMTGDIPNLSGSVLTLMGLSSVTSLVSAGVDTSKAKTAPVPATSGRFFVDLLTDADGITLHRFQMLSMTVILGVIFIVQLITRLTLPEFDESTLGLMGISAGTYLGFKIPEKHGADIPAGDAPGARA